MWRAPAWHPTKNMVRTTGHMGGADTDTEPSKAMRTRGPQCWRYKSQWDGVYSKRFSFWREEAQITEFNEDEEGKPTTKNRKSDGQWMHKTEQRGKTTRNSLQHHQKHAETKKKGNLFPRYKEFLKDNLCNLSDGMEVTKTGILLYELVQGIDKTKEVQRLSWSTFRVALPPIGAAPQLAGRSGSAGSTGPTSSPDYTGSRGSVGSTVPTGLSQSGNRREQQRAVLNTTSPTGSTGSTGSPDSAGPTDPTTSPTTHRRQLERNSPGVVNMLAKTRGLLQAERAAWGCRG